MMRLLACLLAAMIGTTPALGATPRPNVLFLLADDQSPYTVAALGNRVIHTPNLDRLATSGMVFTRAVSNNPLCVPIRAEILTGCTGFTNGVLPGYSNKPNRDLVSWGQAFKQAGYRTGWVGKWHISGRPSSNGYEESDGLFSSGGKTLTYPNDSYGRPVTGYRGWVFQTDGGSDPKSRKLFLEEGVGVTPDISRKFADAAIRLITKKSDRPWLVQVNFTAPHDPLFWPPGYENRYDWRQIAVPENFVPQHPFDHGNLYGRDEVLLPIPRTKQDIQKELAIYYAVISDMDEQIGRILATLDATGQRDNTIVIFSADHGMAKGSHGLIGKQNMYEHTVGVPLIFAGPGVPRGRKTDAIINMRDLYPTTCEMVGVPIPPTVEGRSLAPVIAGKAEKVHDLAFGYFTGQQRMVRDGNWKLIWYPHLDRYQLFDLASDPHEMRDLADDPAHAAKQSELKAKLTAWQKSVNDPVLAGNLGEARKSGKKPE